MIKVREIDTELARRLNSVKGEYQPPVFYRPGFFARLFRGERPAEIPPDSAPELERLGIKVLDKFDRFMYSVRLPEGWSTKPTPECDNGYWSSVYDGDGTERIRQFRKLHERLPAPLCFMESEEARTENAFLDIR